MTRLWALRPLCSTTGKSERHDTFVTRTSKSNMYSKIEAGDSGYSHTQKSKSNMYSKIEAGDSGYSHTPKKKKKKNVFASRIRKENSKQTNKQKNKKKKDQDGAHVITHLSSIDTLTKSNMYSKTEVGDSEFLFKKSPFSLQGYIRAEI